MLNVRHPIMLCSTKGSGRVGWEGDREGRAGPPVKRSLTPGSFVVLMPPRQRLECGLMQGWALI
jgi:hypothetical protein